MLISKRRCLVRARNLFTIKPAFQVWAAYSPVKNSPKDAKAKAQGGNPSHSATTGELDVYQVNCR